MRSFFLLLPHPQKLRQPPQIILLHLATRLIIMLPLNRRIIMPHNMPHQLGRATTIQQKRCRRRTQRVERLTLKTPRTPRTLKLQLSRLHNTILLQQLPELNTQLRRLIPRLSIPQLSIRKHPLTPTTRRRPPPLQQRPQRLNQRLRHRLIRLVRPHLHQPTRKIHRIPPQQRHLPQTQTTQQHTHRHHIRPLIRQHLQHPLHLLPRERLTLTRLIQRPLRHPHTTERIHLNQPLRHRPIKQRTNHRQPPIHRTASNFIQRRPHIILSHRHRKTPQRHIRRSRHQAQQTPHRHRTIIITPLLPPPRQKTPGKLPQRHRLATPATRHRPHRTHRQLHRHLPLIRPLHTIRHPLRQLLQLLSRHPRIPRSRAHMHPRTTPHLLTIYPQPTPNPTITALYQPGHITFLSFTILLFAFIS